jgi:hypothetical protein
MSKFRDLIVETLRKSFEDIVSEYTNLSEDEQIKTVTDDPAHILYINNPSEKVQLAAVKTYGGALKDIFKLKRDGRLQSGPSDMIIRAAIENYPFAIVNLPTSMQTQELQSLAVSKKPNAVLYIWKPTEQTWQELKDQYPQYFDVIYKNWSENYAERQARKAAKAAASDPKKESELEEGKFGKFLGTMATAATLGLGGLQSNPAVAAQYQPDHQEQVLRTQMNQNPPKWIEDSGKLSANDGKLFFTNEIIRDSKSDNTAMLTRTAAAEAGAKLSKSLINAVNSNLRQNMNQIGDNLKISTMIPKKSFWMLLDSDDGKEYHAYAQIQVDQNQIINSLVSSIKSANKNISQQQAQKIAQNAMGAILK